MCRMVAVSASSLPSTAPRYLMGVGHQVGHLHTCTPAHLHTCTPAHLHTCTHAHLQVDLVVCCALGIDMFDCVYPSRTARYDN